MFGCKKEEKQTLSPEALEIKNTILQQMELFDAPGIAFGMIKNDTIVYADAHGVKSLDTKNAVSILKNAVLNDSIRAKGPIHYKLKDYILKDGIEKVKEIYYAEKQKTLQDYTFESGDIDDLGYWLIDRNHLKKVLDIFMFNTELQPEEAGWVDSVADAYKAMDSNDLAIKWYKKALEMKPNQEFSRRKLNELLENSSNR